MPAGWPLTGRDEDLRFVARSLRRDGEPAGVVLAGAAGVGKTRLAREALAASAGVGSTVHWVTATASARDLPLGCFTHLLGPAGATAGSPDAAVRAASATIRGPGAVLAVDDAHLLDAASATLVHQIAVPPTVRTPALRAVEAPLPLTVREREVADLAASGLSNREIADRLVVSVRTVQGHVYRACAKLGVTDRAALAGLMGR